MTQLFDDYARPNQQPTGCRWIESDPVHDPDWGYCQKPRERGYWYCPKHARLAYKPAEEEARK